MVSAKEVQELRKISGAGMMECKNALTESNGNVEDAFKLLREKGIAKAEKKALRDANEGLIGIKIKGDKATIIEINSETDFVSRNSEFHKLVDSILNLSISNFDNSEKTMSQATDLVSDAVSKIGENIILRKVASIKGNIFSYVHNSVCENMGKIGVIISIKSEEKNLDEIGKNLCMHIAASSPKSISVDDLDQTVVEMEKEIINKQLKDSGKPSNIIEKMLDGKIKKFTEESTLLGQKFVIDPSLSVLQYLEQEEKSRNCRISIDKFIRFEIGL